MAQSIIDDIAVVEQGEGQKTADGFELRTAGNTQVQSIEEIYGDNGVRIKVFGVGGGGGNALQHMIDSGLKHVVFCAANTDMQALRRSTAHVKLQLGEKLTNGRGAGADPNVGRDAALESINLIREAIGDAEMVFVTAGMGGGTGTGAASIIAQVAKEMGALTVGVVTKPFKYEGSKRMNAAEAGLADLKQHVDCLITIPNDNLKIFAPKKAAFKDMLQKANDVLYNAVSGISDVITGDALINCDFADVKTVMSESGMALMATGVASGENRAREAAQRAITSPLLEDVSLETAKAVLYNITASDEVSMDEISEIGDIIDEATPDDTNVIFGLALDPNMGDELRLTIIATGIEAVAPAAPQPVTRTEFPRPTYNPADRQRPLARPQQANLLDNYEGQPQRGRVAVGDWYVQGDSRPPYQRKREYMENSNAQMHRHAPGQQDFIFDESADDFEVPTFIRSQAD